MSVSNGPISSSSNPSRSASGPRGPQEEEHNQRECHSAHAIALVRAKATLENSFANYSHVIEKLNVTGPIIDDKLAYRLTGLFDKGDGWIHEQGHWAGAIQNNDRWGVQGNYYVGEDITDRVIFELMGRRMNISARTTIMGARQFGLDLRQWNALACHSRRLRGTSFSISHDDPWIKSSPEYTHSAAFSQQTITGASNELNWQIGDNTFTSITAWAFNVDHPNDTDKEPRNKSRADSGQSTTARRAIFPRARALPLRRSRRWNGNRPLHTSIADMVVQPDRFRQQRGTMVRLRRELIRKCSIASSSIPTDGPEPSRSPAYTNEHLHVDDRLSLTFGLRDSYEIKEGSVFAWERMWNTAYTVAQTDTAVRGGGGGGIYDTGGQTRTRNMLTGVFNPSYKIDDNILLFGLVGRGEKSSQVNVSAKSVWSGTSSGMAAALHQAREQLGLRVRRENQLARREADRQFQSLLDRNLQLSIQYGRYELRRVQRPAAPANLSRQCSPCPLARVRIRGPLEPGRAPAAARQRRLSEARYIDFANAAPPSDWVWSTPSPAPAGFITAPLTLSRSNTRWELLPKWAVNVGADYAHPLGPIFKDFGPGWERPVSAFGYFNVAWQDRMQMTDPHSVIQYWQPAYSIVNAGLGLRTDDNRYSFQLWSKNITDQRWIKSWTVGTPTTPAYVPDPRLSENLRWDTACHARMKRGVAHSELLHASRHMNDGRTAEWTAAPFPLT